MRPILKPVSSVNHTVPSGPFAIHFGLAAQSRDRELGNHAIDRHPANFVPLRLGNPNITVRSTGDTARGAVQSRDRELSDCPFVRNTTNHVPAGFGEPDIPVGPPRDASRIASNCDWKLLNLAVLINSADLVAAEFCEPQMPIVTTGNRKGLAIWSRDGELAQGAMPRHTADFVATILGEPDVVIRDGNPDWSA